MGASIVSPADIVNNRRILSSFLILYRSAFIGYTSCMEQVNASARKTKLLYVVESFSTGVYAIVRDIACNLDPQRFELLILHSLRDDSPKDPQKDFTGAHITLRYLPMGSSKEYLPAVKAIRTVIKEFRPDCIHLHSSKAGFLGRLAAKGLCRHVLYSPHGFSFLRTDVGSLKRWLFFQLEYWINRYAPSKIIAVSEGERAHALRISRDAIVINNFIDTKVFQADSQEETSSIVTCGRISPQKNPALFNEIAKALPSLQFLWVGDGPLRATLTAPNIRITGLLPRGEAIEQVKRAFIYLQTSLWEGMPVSILEAMAAGKAVVASHVVGNRDLIQDAHTGFLCDPSEAEQFIDRIRMLCASEETRSRVGSHARTYILAHHDLRKAIESYQRLYEHS